MSFDSSRLTSLLKTKYSLPHSVLIILEIPNNDINSTIS